MSGKQWTILIDEAGVAPGSEQGDRAVLVEENAHCAECGQQHDIETCPKCGAWIEIGYGLMFGGCGTYKYCSRQPQCDWFWKREDDE